VTFGYSRALRIGDRIVVSGCTAVRDGVVVHPGDAAGQMEIALDAALAAIEGLGGAVQDVVQTRMYVIDRGDCADVGRAHGRRFASIGPAATMVVVAGLLDPEMLVEVEMEAVVS
jgi:enamine deaminase RidA (YjgF/YER057c/UK114 family)